MARAFTPATMQNYLGYIRVSTPKQGTHGSSLQEQKSAIETYASRNGLSVNAWFEERETAAKQGRQIFARMLKELDKGRASGVIIHKIDRSARNLKDWANLGELIDRGIDVRFAHDGLDLTSRGGRLSADIQAVVAADFIRNLRDEVKKGFYGRLKQGVYPLKAPIGYRDMGRGKPKEFNPIQAPLVRQAFELYATGEYSFETLQAELERRGLRGRGGALISKNGLTTMLNNPFYIGLMRIRKTNEIFQGAHPPLITKTLFERVQAVLRGNRIGTPWKHDFLFRRMIRCAHCGRHLIGERKKDRYTYYRCHDRACGGVCISQARVDDRVRELFRLLHLDEEEIRDLRDMIDDIRTQAKDEAAEREVAVRMQIGKCDERLSRLTDALIDGLLDKQTFDARKEALLKERRGVLDQLEQNAEMPSVADRLSKYLELTNTAYLQYDSGISSEMRDIVLSTTSNFSGDGNCPAITLKSPFQELVNWRISRDSELRQDNARTRAREIIKILTDANEEDIAHLVTDFKRIAGSQKKKSPNWEKLEEFNRKRYGAKVKKKIEDELRP